MEKIVEICCGGYEDALKAFNGGAKRIELNSALSLGGLTPSVGALIATKMLTKISIKENTNLKVIAMVRPRGAGFCYSEEDFVIMMKDAEILLKNGADGIAFGFLNEDKSICREKTIKMVQLIKKIGGEAVFHRAFDCVSNPYEGIETLIDIGVNRVLTSGLQEKAIDGVDLIADLQKKYGNKIEILAGSGINAQNAKEIMEKTGICQIHSSCKDWVKDTTTIGNHVSYGYATFPHENDYEVVSQELVENLLKSL